MIKPLNQKKIDFLEELYEVIKSRDKSRVKNSYTKLLLKSGKNKIAQKIAEESSELLIDYLSGSKNSFFNFCFSCSNSSLNSLML